MTAEAIQIEDSHSETLKRAEAAVAGLRDAYREQLVSDLERLENLQTELEEGLNPHDYLSGVHAVAHDIKGQGGSFGYPLATDIGASLSDVSEADAAPSAARVNIVLLHMRMLRLLSDKDLAGDGGALGVTFRNKLLRLSELTSS